MDAETRALEMRGRFGARYERYLKMADKVEFTREEKQAIFFALKAAITGTLRAAGKQGIPLAKEAMLRHVREMELVAAKVEKW